MAIRHPWSIHCNQPLSLGDIVPSQHAWEEPGQKQNHNENVVSGGTPLHDEYELGGLASILRRPEMEKAVKGPRRPCDVERNQVLARRRIEELHKIFTSPHTKEAESLRHQLAIVDAEYTEVKRKLAAVEEQHKILQRKLTTEKERMEQSREGSSVASEQSRDQQSHAASSQTSVDDLGERPALSETGSTAEAVEQQVKEQTQEEELRNQLEQTLQSQDDLVVDLRREIKEYQEQRKAQEKWVEGLGEAERDVQIRLMRYRVRLGTAEERTTKLMMDLRNSYNRMANLVRERIETRGEAAKNDAFLKYSEMVHKLSLEHHAEDNSLENRQHLRRLKLTNQNLDEMEGRSAELRNQLEAEADAGESIVKKCKLIVAWLEVLQQTWTTLPSELKHTLHALKEEQLTGSGTPSGQQFKGRWPPHPVNGIKRMRDCITSVDGKINSVVTDTQAQVQRLEHRPRHDNLNT